MALGLAAWGRALDAGLPEAVRHAFGIGARVLKVAIPASSGDVCLFDAENGQQIASGDKAKRLALSRNRPAIALVLPRSEAVEATLTVPETARHSLDDVIDAEIGRVTPFRADDVHVGRSVTRDGMGQLRIELLVVPRQTVRAARERLEAEGIKPDFVSLESETVSGLRSSALIPPPSGRMGGGVRFLPLLAFASLIAAVISPFLHQEIGREAVRETLDAQKPRVEHLTRLADAVGNIEADRSAFISAFGPTQQGRIPTILETLSNLLPDTGHLHTVEIRGDQLIMEGRIPRAAPLLAAIETIPAFADAAFDAPVTRDPTTGDERFRITATLTPSGGDT